MSASESSVRRLGNLSAGEDGRARRRRGRSAARACVGRRRDAVARSRLPGDQGQACRRHGRARISPICSAGRRALLAGQAEGLDLFAIDAPHLYDRPGNPYLGPDGLDWPDNARRFAALARVGADIGLGAVAAFEPEVVHAHDWQAALAPAYLRFAEGRRPGSVVTIHNLAFQGHFPISVFWELGLPDRALAIDGVEYFGGVGYLKAGLQLADVITTVSPTYAREILTPEFGMALDGLLRARSRAVHGILNGVDDSVWNPATDPALPQNFGATRSTCGRATRPRFKPSSG